MEICYLQKLTVFDVFMSLSCSLTVILTHTYCFPTVILPVVTVWSCLTCQWRLGTMEWQRTSTGSVLNLCKYYYNLNLFRVHPSRKIFTIKFFIDFCKTLLSPMCACMYFCFIVQEFFLMFGNIVLLMYNQTMSQSVWLIIKK